MVKLEKDTNRISSTLGLGSSTCALVVHSVIPSLTHKYSHTYKYTLIKINQMMLIFGTGVISFINTFLGKGSMKMCSFLCDDLTIYNQI